MDYMFLSAIRHFSPGRLVISYDIACQWYKNFFTRLLQLPNSVQFKVIRDFYQFTVPKLHIMGHELECQEGFSLLFLPGASSTDAEGIEQHWANLGPIGTSTREMGPGHRRDIIDDHLGNWNFKKLRNLG